MVDGVEVDDAVVAFVDEEDSPDLDCFGVSVCSLCVNKVSDLKISFTLMGLVEVDLELPLKRERTSVAFTRYCMRLGSIPSKG